MRLVDRGTRGSAAATAAALLILFGPASCRDSRRASDTDAQRERAPGHETLAFAPPGGDGPADRGVARAQEAVRAAAATPARRADAWTGLARAWVQKAREAGDPGFYLNANACAEAALRLAPADRGALHVRALVLLDAHRFDDALRVADALVAKDGDDAVAHGLRSDALLDLGREEEAIAAAQRMMSLKPGVPAYARASYLLWLQGDVPGAREAARRAAAAAVDPRNPEPRAWAIVQAARLFWHEGDLEGAEAGFDLALRELPSYPPALAGKARARLAARDFDAAVALAERAWRRTPLVETAWLLGDAREAAGDVKGAEQAWALAVAHGRAADPRGLAAFLAAKGRRGDEALRVARAEYERRPTIHAADTLAWALHRAGRDAEAAPFVERALRLGTRDAQLLFHAGAIRIALGETARGRQLVAAALKLNPAFDAAGAREARALLDGGNDERAAARVRGAAPDGRGR